MLQPTILFITWRYIRSTKIEQFNKYIYWVSSISIMLTVMTLIVVLSIMNGFERNLKQDFLYFTPHMFLTTVQGYTHVDDISREIVCNQCFIEYMQPLVVSDVILQSSKKISFGSMLGVNPNYFEPLSNYLINNHINQLIPKKYYIIIGSTLARYLEVNIYDQIRVIIPAVIQTTPFGCFPSQRLFIISDIYETHRDIDDYQVLVHQLDACKLMHYPSEHHITGWRIWLREPFMINNFNQLCLSNNWIYKDWRDDKGPLFQAMQIERNIISLSLGLIIIVSCFNIMSFLVLLIMEKKMEIAILQTHGLTRFKIMLIFVMQGISNGIIGIIFGVGLGVLLSKKLNDILHFFNILPNTLQIFIEIQGYQILMMTIMIFLIVILITLYPSWTATSVSPAVILRYK